MPKVRGEGSIIQLERDKPRSKCRKWQLRISAGKNKRTGKYPQFTRTVKGTYTEARAAMREFIQEVETDKVTVRRMDARNFKEYSGAWLEQQKDQVAWGTWRKFVDHIKCLNMHLGYAALHEIDFEDLENAYAALSLGESPSGRPLSGTYLSGIATTAHKLFKQMVKDRLIVANPTDYAEHPRPDTKEKKSLTRAQIDDLTSKLDPAQPTQLVLLLGVKLGLRRGEAHGLSWSDIDFDAKVVHVRYSYDENGNLKAPKNGKVRSIPLTPSAEADLDAMLDRQMKLFARVRRKHDALVPVVTSDTPVICNGFGERMLPRSSTQWFDRHRAELGFAGWTIHEMRHSFVTNLRRKKVDARIAQRFAGHSSVKVTEGIYEFWSSDILTGSQTVMP